MRHVGWVYQKVRNIVFIIFLPVYFSCMCVCVCSYKYSHVIIIFCTRVNIIKYMREMPCC